MRLMIGARVRRAARRPLCAAAVLAAVAAGCADDDSSPTPSGPLAPPTPTRAPRAFGPGLGNLPYSQDELMKPVSLLRSPRGHGNAAIVGGYLMVIYSSDGGGRSGDGGIELWDVSDPRNPVVVKQYDDANTHLLREAHGFAFSTNYAFDLMVAQSEEGVSFWDVTDPHAFALVSKLDLPNINGGDYAGVWWTFLQAPYVYAAGVGEGLYVIDASDPLNPLVVNWIATGDIAGMSPAQAYALGNLLVLTAHESDRVVTFDISDPVRPRLLASGKAAFGYSQLFAGGQILTSGGPQLESVIPILDGGEPIFAPRTLGITDVGHDGSITFVKHGQQASLDQGGYGSVQDGFFFGGFSKQIAKFTLGEANIVATAASGFEDADHDFGLVLGNLVWGGNDHSEGSGLYPHQLEPDSVGPEVTWVHPADGAVNQSPTSRIGVSMSDQVDIYSVDSTTFSVARRGEPPLPGKYSVQMGLINFAPEQPLEANETYEVRVAGVRDVAGNAGGIFASTFKTGTEALPSCRLANADEGLPAATTGTPVSFQAIALSGRAPLRFTWDFGDGTAAPTETARHAYANPGRYNVVLTVADRFGRQACSAVQIVYNPPTDPAPSAAGTIAYSGGKAFVVHPDDDVVSAVDAATLRRIWEKPVGRHPRTLAVAPDGNTIWTANQDDATVSVISAEDGTLLQTIELPFASQPYGVAFAPDASAAFVTLQATREVVKLGPDGGIAARLGLDGKPRGVAVTADSRRVLVTRFLSAMPEAQVWMIDTQSFDLAQSIGLHFDAGPDTEESGRGLPNYLTSIAISPDGRRALVPSKKDNLARGLFRDGQELDFESRVRTVVSQIDLDRGEEIEAARIDLNDRDMAQSAVFSPYGDIFFTATQGTNTIEIVDTYRATTIGTLVPRQFDEVEGLGRRVNNLAPQGLAIDPQGTKLFVHNFLSRSVSVYDVAAVVRGVRNSAPMLTEIKMVDTELLNARVLIGKRIFYNASDPRMSRDGYLSCASCHLDGTHDGQVWDFTQVGEGLRNTIDLTGRGGTGHGRLHWTANFDEIQDFENDIRAQFSGKGFMRDDRFAAAEDPLGPPKARASTDLDSLAIYVSSLLTFPPSPHRNPEGSLTDAGVRGKAIFAARDCAQCHAGPTFTDGQRHDVGTIRPSSGLGIHQSLQGVGFDTPTLKGIWDTAPYLHDGSAPALDEVLDYPAHVGEEPLTAAERADLVAYLLQIDDGESP
jgi:DNA-binding beta-propeller fold protein YncE/cytochrome c peroxidase